MSNIKDLMNNPVFMGAAKKKIEDEMKTIMEPIVMKDMEDSFNDAIDIVVSLFDDMEEKVITVEAAKELIKILKFKH